MSEDMKQIPGYNNYWINKEGFVISTKAKTAKVLKASPTGPKRDYYCVCLYQNQEKHVYKVHRLVAEAFIPNPENKPHINHKDGNKANNHVDNLEWCTPKENTAHAWKNGLMNPKRGTGHHGAKFTDSQIVEIKKRHVPHCRTNGTGALAREFGVHRNTIADIIKGRSWREQDD